MDKYEGPALAGQAEVIRWLSGIFLFVLLLVVTADIYTYGYDSYYLALPIVVLHAQPSLGAVIGAAIFVLAVNVIAAIVPKLHFGALLARIFQSGVYIGLLQTATKAGGAVVFAIVAYAAFPFAVGFLIASLQTNYRVVTFTPPEHADNVGSISEAIIVGPSADGVLLALYDRKQNAVIPRVFYDDTLASYQPRVFRSEQLGHLRKAP